MDCDCVIHGGGEVIGSNVILTLETARNNEGLSDTALEIQTYHVTLSLSSLDGTYKRYFTCCGESTSLTGTTKFESARLGFLVNNALNAYGLKVGIYEEDWSTFVRSDYYYNPLSLLIIL